MQVEREGPCIQQSIQSSELVVTLRQQVHASAAIYEVAIVNSNIHSFK